MSELFVKELKIQHIKEHPNADRLEIAFVNGSWPVIIQKDSYKIGDGVIFVPLDSMVPLNLAKEWGVDKYLSIKKNSEHGRVRAAKIRKEISMGILIDPLKYPDRPSGDLKDFFGIYKYEPPEKVIQGDIEKDHSLFPHGYDIQNFRNFPDVFISGEQIRITEKIHGTHWKGGWVHDEDELLIGSHKTRRKLGQNSIYELPIRNENIVEMIKAIIEEYKNREFTFNVIVFGEIYGTRVQDLTYGLKNDEKDYRIFDIMVNGKFLNVRDFDFWTKKFNIPVVPVLYDGKYNKEEFLTMADGRYSSICKKQISEGVVIKPHEERADDELGRVILKLINNEYLLRKGGTEDH